MSSGPDSTDCVRAAFGGGTWGPGVSKCADISTIFSEISRGSRGYIQYCSHYTKLTNDYRTNILSTADRSCLNDNHVDTSTATAKNVVDTIVPCLTAYCEDSTGCKTQNLFPCLQESLVINGTMLRNDTIGSCIDQICTNHPTLQANSNIADIDIIASYIAQTGIALLIALTLLFLTIWPEIRNAPMTTNHQSWSTYKHSKPSPQPIPDALKKNELYESLHQTLIAFLLAQNFLALTISIATLQTLNSSRALGTLDETALESASGSIILPTAFELYTLASFYRESQS